MKKTCQSLIFIFSLTITLTFTASAFAQDCILEWWTDSSECKQCVGSDCTNYCDMGGPIGPIYPFSAVGTAATAEISRTQQATLEVFQHIFSETPVFDLDCYASFTGSDVGGESKEVCMDGTWAGSSIAKDWIPFYWSLNSTYSGGWDVVCGPEADIDNDGVFDIEDNCPDVANPEQKDYDSDGVGNSCDNCADTANHSQEDTDSDDIGDVCDENTIYGTVTGDIQEGIVVNIYILSCGALQPHATVTTDAQGYYATGDLPDRRYLVGPEEAGYSFSSSYWVDISQTEIKSYDFTATENIQ